MPTPQSVSFEIGEHTIVLETGQIARQAHGAVVAKQGDAFVMATVVSARSASDADFFPLTVSYRAKMAAAGRILLAEAAIGEGRTQTASEALAEAWPVIEAKVECLLDPLDTLAECQRIATVLGDDTIASQAHQLADARLRSVAASITDPDVVRAFLDSAPARTVRAQAP